MTERAFKAATQAELRFAMLNVLQYVFSLQPNFGLPATLLKQRHANS